MHESSGNRYLIVNADDFGLTDGINRGIIEAHENGVVTSTSLMIRYPAAQRAAELARTNSTLSIGLHFDIAEWRFQNGEWSAVYQVINARDTKAIEDEWQRQLEMFERLIGRWPTHVDSHQHIHNSEPAREILLRASDELGVPLRGCDTSIRHCGDFYGQTAEGQPFLAGISGARIKEMIERLEPGWTEIGCHPGYIDQLDSVYLSEREMELRVLCSPEVGAAIEQEKIQLSSFRDYLDSRQKSAR